MSGDVYHVLAFYGFKRDKKAMKRLFHAGYATLQDDAWTDDFDEGY